MLHRRVAGKQLIGNGDDLVEGGGAGVDNGELVELIALGVVLRLAVV